MDGFRVRVPFIFSMLVASFKVVDVLSCKNCDFEKGNTDRGQEGESIGQWQAHIINLLLLS